LHPGRVMFGNIGLPERLNFSVIGRAVNEAARVADQCRPLDEIIVVSERFRELAGGGDGADIEIKWRALGAFELRNVDQPMKLFAPS